MTRRLRIATYVALSLYVAFMLAVLLWPSPVDKPVSGQIREVINTAHSAGAPKNLGYTLIENVGNIALFVPLGALLAMLLPRPRRWLALAFGFLFACAIEITQGLLLPERTASWVDVVSNTIGTLIGLLLILGLHFLRRQWKRSVLQDSSRASPRV